jgi:uncharacterized damage-inducible protein DinB
MMVEEAMPMPSTDPLRSQLSQYLAWKEAHAGFDAAVKDVPFELQGRQPAGLPHSPWQLLEHLRIAQDDILDFCRNPNYVHKKWPDDYWPKNPAPPDARAWEQSVAAYRRDREAMQQLTTDPAVDLFARIPHGDTQTYIREVLLIADHASYHVGQLVLVRRLLGDWTER